MDTKMRIKLFDDEEKQISDRLVEQATEFMVGPKDNHKGPLSVEVNLRSKEDVEKLKEYLDKLTGNLPLIKKPMKIPSGKGTVTLDESAEPQEEMVTQILGKAKFQEDLIAILREHNFRFIDTETISEMVPDLKEKMEIREKHFKYQWMIRMIKEAKDPRNDRYDHRILIGIKIVGKKFEKVQIYLFGKYCKTSKLPWKDAIKTNFKKVKHLTKFPEFMDYEDRKKWRVEHRKVETNPNHKASKFYSKHLPYIKFID